MSRAHSYAGLKRSETLPGSAFLHTREGKRIPRVLLFLAYYRELIVTILSIFKKKQLYSSSLKYIQHNRPPFKIVDVFHYDMLVFLSLGADVPSSSFPQ